jgi:hypothetical protein
MEEAQALSSKSQCAADESVNIDDPIIHKNVSEFHVCYDTEGMSNSILWMDSRMHSNLIRLGDILILVFLDVHLLPKMTTSVLLRLLSPLL